MPSWLGGLVGSGPVQEPPSFRTLTPGSGTLLQGAASMKAQPGYASGDAVEYYSATQARWIPAKVLAVNADGTFNLDCKPDVLSDKIRRPVQPAGDYAAGEIVEYFGATQGKWIKAKVLSANGDGTFDLDCKPGVLSDKIRRPTSGQQGAVFAAGEVVEYFSASQNGWIPAKVLARNADGSYNLDCKPDVPPDKVRPAAAVPATGLGTGTGAADKLAEGETVEYFGATMGKWIPAKVLRANPDGTYDLDCKPQVPRDKVRRLADAGKASAGATFAAGDVVEYFSATQGCWIPAKVVSVNPSGTYHLDCKPEVPADKIRRPAAVAEDPAEGPAVGPVAPRFQAGDVVEYFGTTHKKWIPAKVLNANPDGTYDLDCKPQVPPDRIKALPAHEHRVGDSVEYFSASLSKWVPARVLANNPNGTYDLDCKPQVAADKIRRPEDEQELLRPLREPPSDGTGLRAAAGLDEPVQLLRVVKGGDGARKYELCAEGAAALERHGSRRIAVTSVCGPGQTGKSLLLNLLLERTQQGLASYRVGSAEQPGTNGLWIWGSLDEEDERSPLLAFIDCEGFAGRSQDASHDMHLMTLCALLSSVVVLNSKGILNEDLFNTLAPACRFGENIEEPGNESNRPALVWVLRDFALSLDGMTADEYLEKALHAAASAGDSDERRRSAREVRQTLMCFFKNRGCATLAQPAAETSQLLKLDGLPYARLKPEFRAGVEALRAQLISTCRANLKSVGGQPLGCFAFVALARQLVAAVNDDRVLNMKGAWETVQHTSCGGLTDELRDKATKVLHALSAGEPVPGGARLPMTDEALRAVVRDQRRQLKVQWEERAVGDETVRREYWQELKEALGREEKLVCVQNTRLADQQLMEALRAWQDWLDSENDAAASSVDEICRKLGGMMEQVPAVALSRAGKAAVQAALRRVAEAHSAVHATAKHHENLHAEVVAQGEHHVLEEAEAKRQLEGKRSAIADALDEVSAQRSTCQAAQEKLGALDIELRDAKAELETAVRDAAAARASELEVKAQQRVLTDTEAALRSEMEQVRADAARAEAERLAAERLAQGAEEAFSARKQRLEEEVARARAEAEELAGQLEGERQHLKGESEKTRTEHEQRVEEVRKQLEEERSKFHGEKDQTASQHMRLAEEARRELEEQRTRHTGLLEGHKNRLLENERHAGVLEGKQATLSSETQSLRERLRELEVQAKEAVVLADQRAQEAEQTKLELEGVRAATERSRVELGYVLQAQEEEYERKAEYEASTATGRKPRCGCTVQ